MTEMTHAPPVEGEQSTTGQAKEKVQEAAGQMKVGERAQQLRGQAGDTVRQELDNRSTNAGHQVSATADALRRVGSQLRDEGKGTPAQYAERVAEPVERLGRYLTEADGDRILRDAEQFARRRPWVAVLGGATLGFFVARFIKASSAQDGQEMQQGPYGQTGPYGRPALPAPPPAGEMGGIDVDTR